MSKSGSRYGRRSNWFKIHCLLQEQQQQKSNVPTSPGALPNNAFMPTHFLTNLCNNIKIDQQQQQRITRSPSDSGASSAADLDESNREGSIESFSFKIEKYSVPSPTIFENFHSSFSPYLKQQHLHKPYSIPNGRPDPDTPQSAKNQISMSPTIYSTPISTATAAAAAASASPVALSRNSTPLTSTPPSHPNDQNQDEPLDLSTKSRKRLRIPSPPNHFDHPKPIPLDLTLVRSSKSLSEYIFNNNNSKPQQNNSLMIKMDRSEIENIN